MPLCSTAAAPGPAGRTRLPRATAPRLTNAWASALAVPVRVPLALAFALLLASAFAAAARAAAAPSGATATAAQTGTTTPSAAPPATSSATSTNATSAKTATNSAAAADEVEKYLDGLASWTADFTQTIDDGHGKVVRSAAGKLYLQKPGKFRWDYSEPSEQLILADGKQIWFYDKDLQQANVRDMDANLANTPAVLLSGGGSVSSQFDVTSLPPNGGLKWYQLIPKHTDTDFQLVRIGFRNGELASMFLADKLNQVTQLTFSNSQRNAKFAPDLFSFTPPPGVDVIGRGP